LEAALRSFLYRSAAVVAVGAATVVVVWPPAVGAVAVESPQLMRFDGGGRDAVEAVAVDAAGNVYLGGASGRPGTGVTFSVVKLSPQGVLVWRSTYSGARDGVDGHVRAIAVDQDGTVYAAGSVSDGATRGANIDSLVVKVGADGAERWAHRYDGPVGGFDQATDIVLDRSGAVYVAGISHGLGFDWFTQRFGPDGVPQWTSRNSGPGVFDDMVGDLALAPNDDVVVAGTTQRIGDGMTNDVEVVVYTPHGAIVRQQRWSDTPASHELVQDLDIDASGRITVTGSTAQTASPEFGVPLPFTLRHDATGALSRIIRSGGDAVDTDATGNFYVTGSFTGTPEASATSKYDTAGDRLWTTALSVGPREMFAVTAIAVDSLGAVTVAGSVTRNDTLNKDYLTIRYAADGRELWRHRFDGTARGEDRLAGLAVDAAGTALVAGTSVSNAAGGGTTEDMVALRFPAGATPIGGPPPAPSQLTASAISRSQVQLRWHDGSSTETSFRVERCRGAGCTAFVQIAVTGPDVTAFVDSGLTRNTTYTYRVRAIDTHGATPYSNQATARTRTS
jgi:hypothetical protein